MIRSSILALSLLIAPFAAAQLLYVGTYTNGASRGIYAFRFAGGRLDPVGLVAETSNPSFLAVHPKQPVLYAVNEQAQGMVTSFSIDSATGKLTLLNSVSSRGAAPCHLSVDATGRWLAVANYNSGSVAIFQLRQDGAIGESSAFVEHAGSSVHERQKGPHAHEAVFSPDNRSLLVPDLGTDRVVVYPFNQEKGSLGTPAPVRLPPGSGPRHLLFHGQGLLVVSELSNTLSLFRKQGSEWHLAQTETTLPSGFSGRNTAAELQSSVDGKVIYVSNRGADDLAQFEMREGKLVASGHVPSGGKRPRHFVIDPAGKYLLAANQDSNNITLYEVDQKSSGLKPVGTPAAVAAPVCLVFSRRI